MREERKKKTMDSSRERASLNKCSFLFHTLQCLIIYTAIVLNPSAHNYHYKTFFFFFFFFF